MRFKFVKQFTIVSMWAPNFILSAWNRIPASCFTWWLIWSFQKAPQQEMKAITLSFCTLTTGMPKTCKRKLCQARLSKLLDFSLHLASCHSLSICVVLPCPQRSLLLTFSVLEGYTLCQIHPAIFNYTSNKISEILSVYIFPQPFLTKISLH